MFLSLHRDRDPFYLNPFREYHRIRQELDDLLSPTFYMMQHMGPRGVVQGQASSDPNQFQVRMDVSQFAPEELAVKVMDNSVVVEGKHEEKEDEQGFISRQFVRRWAIPEDVKPEAVVCNLSSDGVLTLTAPRAIEEKAARTLPINLTGQPALKEKEGEAAAAEKKLLEGQDAKVQKEATQGA